MKRIIIFVFFLTIFSFLFLFVTPNNNLSNAASPCETNGYFCLNTCAPDRLSVAYACASSTNVCCGAPGSGVPGLPRDDIPAGCGNSADQVWTLDCIFPILKNVVDWALIFSGIVAVFLIIFSGIKFITSGGNPKNVDSAKKTLTYAILGLLLILLSFFIINIISYATGVSCIKIMGFNACP